MTCPTCGQDNDRVINSRDRKDHVYRLRECKGCGARFETLEKVSAVVTGRKRGHQNGNGKRD